MLQLAKDRDVNESDTVSIVNDILGEVFGYDKYLEVTSELAIRGTFCDLALKVDGKIQFLVEVKAIGIELKPNHVRQAVDYGANNGVPWVVLTNGIDWRLYRIRFEQPIAYDVVNCFSFTTVDPQAEKDQEILSTLSCEGLGRGAREEYYEKAQSFNRYIVGSLILSEPVIELVRRELRKLSDGLKVDVEEVEHMIRGEVLKREVVEGDEAEAAQSRVNKFYRKTQRKRTKEAGEAQESPAQKEQPSLAQPFLGSPFPAIAIFVLTFMSDSLLTVHAARLYKAGADQLIVLEGSYELNPLYAKDVDRLRALSPRFLASLAVYSLLIWAAWYVFVGFLWLPQAYHILIGAVLLAQGPVHIRHVRNIAAFHHAIHGDGIEGRIQYTRWFSFRLSAIEFLSFSVLYAALALLSGSLLLLGGAIATAVLALKSHQGSRITTPRPRAD